MTVPGKKEVDIGQKVGHRGQMKRVQKSNGWEWREGTERSGGEGAQQNPSTNEDRISEVGSTQWGTCDRESDRNMGQDRKGQKDSNNWGEEDEKIKTTNSIIGSRVHSFLPISPGPSPGPLTQDPAVFCEA